MAGNNSIILEELSDLKKEFEEFKKEFKEFSELTLKEANRKNTERPFGMLQLPSKGLFYKNRNKFLLIGYLTYFEENILTSEMMHEADIAMPIILEKVIASNDFDIKEILSCDVQAISMFLRAYAYGNSIEVDVECPHCERKDKHTIMVSDFKSKDINLAPDENGEIEVVSQKFGKKMKIIPRTYFEDMAFKQGVERKMVDTMCFNLCEYEGERDRSKIKQTLSGLKIMESRDIKKAISDNLPGIDTSIVYNCMFCERDTIINFGHNGADFLRLPSSFINNVLEELFLLSHYGTSTSIDDVKKMTVGERRWFVNRLSDELNKKKQAEEAAMRSAKSKGKR